MKKLHYLELYVDAQGILKDNSLEEQGDNAYDVSKYVWINYVKGDASDSEVSFNMTNSMYFSAGDEDIVIWSAKAVHPVQTAPDFYKDPEFPDDPALQKEITKLLKYNDSFNKNEKHYEVQPEKIEPAKRPGEDEADQPALLQDFSLSKPQASHIAAVVRGYNAIKRPDLGDDIYQRVEIRGTTEHYQMTFTIHDPKLEGDSDNNTLRSKTQADTRAFTWDPIIRRV